MEVKRMSENKLIHHYLHNQAIGAVESTRDHDRWLEIILPWGERIRNLPVDIRDRRNAVIFEGNIPYGGLPKSATVVLLKQFEISAQTAKMRKDPDYPYIAKPDYGICSPKGIATLTIKRYFMLLPSCSAIVVKYRSDSLSPIYVTINSSFNKKGAGVVEWRTSSY